MRHTVFAGLTQLDPTDPLSSDDYSFQAVNPDIIDRLLKVGARTHRHDGHAALANPTTALVGTAIDSGGSFPPDLSVEFAYTLIDAYSGETAASDIITVTTPAGFSAANVPPGASADYTGGTLRPDVYYYGRSWLDGAGGETELGAVVAVDVDPAASAQVFLDGLNTGRPTGATWRLYRSRGGEDFRKLADGSSNTLTDDGSLCADCTEAPVESNSTAARASIDIDVPAPPAGATSWRLYGRIVSGQWDSFSLLATGTTADTVTLTSFSPDFGRPPDVSLTIAGAMKIDPDTELLDWHWKRPVTSSAGLGSGALGDVRLSTDSGDLWAVLRPAGTLGASGWTHIASGGTGGGGGGSIQEVAASGDGRSVNPTKIKFKGSGSIAVTVADVGGSAVVTLNDGGLVYEAFASAAFLPVYTDDWSADHRSSYIYNLGTAADLTSTGGGVRLTTDVTNVQMYYPSAASDGYCRVGDTIPNANHQSHLMLFSADNPAAYAWVDYTPGGTSEIWAFNGVTQTAIGSWSGTPAAAAGWLYLYRQGDTLTVEFYTALGGAPAFKRSAVLPAGYKEVLGDGKSLRPGWKFFRMVNTGNLYDNFTFDIYGPIGRQTRVRSGSADRKLLGEDSTTDYGIRIQEADGSPTIPDSHHLEFGPGSGSVGVRVIDLGGGSARVEVGGGGGGGASVPGLVSLSGSAGVPIVYDKHHIEFRASGGTSVAVQDLANGSAAVLIGGGGSSGPGLISLSGSAGVTPVYDKHHIEFRASGGTFVAIQDLANGSAAVLISASGVPGVPGPAGSTGGQGATGASGTPGSGAVVERRFNASAQVFNLASGASAITSFPLGAPNGRALRLTANQSNRIRLYAASAYRDADTGRAIGTDPSGDHGVLLDFVTPTSDLNWALSPEVDLASLEPTGPHVTLCGIITNMAAASGVTVGIEYVRSASGDVRAKAKRAASAQSIPNNTWTRLTFDNVVYDNAVMADDPNDQFVVPETGHYIGMIAAEFAVGDPSQSGGARAVALGLNGSDYLQDTTSRVAPAPGVTTVVQTQFEITLNRGDLVYAISDQTSGLPLNVVGFWFSLRRVAQ